jgi:hypothetical protein
MEALPQLTTEFVRSHVDQLPESVMTFPVPA